MPNLKNPLGHVGRQVGIPGARVMFYYYNPNPNSISVEVEGRAEQREEPLHCCCVMLAARLACRICDVCVFFLSGVFWACVASRRAAVQFCFMFMFMCVGVWAGRLSPLPEDAKMLGSEDFFWSIWYNIVNSLSIVFNIVYHFS